MAHTDARKGAQDVTPDVANREEANRKSRY